MRCSSVVYKQEAPHTPEKDTMTAATAAVSTFAAVAERDAHRALAAEAHQAAAESFDRCDTDGFLSQWAHGITARLEEAKAEIAARSGKVLAPALIDVEDGAVLCTHTGYGQYGMWWKLNGLGQARYGRTFVSTSNASTDAKRRAANARKGFSVGRVLVDGHAEIVGGGTGLSGALSCTVAELPSVGALIAGDYTVVVRDIYDPAAV